MISNGSPFSQYHSLKKMMASFSAVREVVVRIRRMCGAELEHLLI